MGGSEMTDRLMYFLCPYNTLTLLSVDVSLSVDGGLASQRGWWGHAI